MLALVETVRRETEARDRKIAAMAHQQRQLRWAIVLVCVGITILLVVAAINATNIAANRKQADQIALVAAKVDRTNSLLLDCLNATGQCGKVNAEQQQRLLSEVKKYELTGFYCIRTNPADRDPRGEAFLKCMERLYPGGPTLDLSRP